MESESSHIMDCKICKENLICYIEGLMDEQQKAAIQEHINICKTCEFEANETVKLYEMLTTRGKEISEDTFLEEKVLKQIHLQKSQSADYNSFANFITSINYLRNNLVKYLIAITVVIALILSTHLLDNSTAEANVTWVKVADNILNAKTATFDVALGGGPIIKNIVSGQYLKEILGNGCENIADYDTGCILLLDTNKKTAYFAKSGNMTNHATNYFQYLKDKIEILKSSPNTKAIDLGTRTINDRPAEGLHIYNDTVDLKIWTDIENGLPALIVYDKTLGQSTLEMSNFKFNVPAEELALSMAVPQDYTLEPLTLDFADPTEQDLIQALDIWANTYLDNHFPEKLDAALLISQAEIINKKNEELQMTEKERLEASIKITRGLLFIQNLPPDSDWQYTGKGATTNDTQCIIFRYKPQASETYRVIYGNLQAKDAELKN